MILCNARVNSSLNSNVILENSIVWGNNLNQILGSADVTYSDVEGGYSGTGNIDIDPYFVDPNSGDLHLLSQAGRWDPATKTWVIDDITSSCIDAGNPSSEWSAELWPHGGHINIGAYGGTPEASMSLSAMGNVADLNNDNAVNGQDFANFANAWQTEQVLLPQDFDRNGTVDLNDVGILCINWLIEF